MILTDTKLRNARAKESLYRLTSSVRGQSSGIDDEESVSRLLLLRRSG